MRGRRLADLSLPTSLAGARAETSPTTRARASSRRLSDGVQGNRLLDALPVNERHSLSDLLQREWCDLNWILLTHDRVGSDEFSLTQEFLSQMLGVRRASVTAAAGVLQRAGLVRFHHGRVTILDRHGLEDASCECYGIVRDEFDRLPVGDGGP